MMRVAGHTHIRLPRRQQFRKLRVALEKFRFVGRDLLKYLYSSVVALIFVLRETQQNRKISRFSTKPVSPFRVTEVFKCSRLVAFFYASRIPSGNEIFSVGGHPVGAFQRRRI